MKIGPDRKRWWSRGFIISSPQPGPRLALSKTLLGKGVRSTSFWGAITGIALLLLTWHLIATYVETNAILLPAPSTVARASIEAIASGLLLQDLLASLGRVAYGFLLASGLGIGLGVVLAMNRWLSLLFYPVLELLRPIPPIAWIPLAILWFGIGDASSEFIVAIGAFFPIFVNTYTGIRGVDRRYLEVSYCLGASARMLILEVILPAALPFILTGLRVGLGVAWMAVVAAELIATNSGLGYMIQLNRTILKTDYVLVGMAAIGLVGYAMAALLERLQRWLTPWQAE